MAENSKIEWTDHTFNPWTGCTKVSPGCDHCYAEGWAKRSGTVKWGAGEPRRRTTAANWKLPLKWNAQAQAEGRRYRVFCASLADVFDNAVDPDWRAELFGLIAGTPHLDWLLLTKRIGNAEAMIREAAGAPDSAPPIELPNVWIGATVVNQEEADRDIPKLLQVPARVRFLSMEPLLGRVNIDPEWWRPNAVWERPDTGIDWVIAGGESGPGARPSHPEWFRWLREQCWAANVPFLFKQWGEWLNEVDASDKGTERSALHKFDDGRYVVRVGKKLAGRLLDGVTHDGYPA